MERERDEVMRKGRGDEEMIKGKGEGEEGGDGEGKGGGQEGGGKGKGRKRSRRGKEVTEEREKVRLERMGGG